MMPADLATALDRFLGSSDCSKRAVAVRTIARTTVQAWRDGLISTQQALRTIAESLEAMHTHDA
jgi:hypothetical protein